MRKKFALLLAALAALFLLSGCKVSGNPLPEGMEEETVLEQGREVVSLLNAGEYQTVYDRLRSDAQAWPRFGRDVTLVDEDGPDGSLLFACRTDPSMSNPLGMVHGGVTASLVDTCMGVTCSAHCGRAATPTVSMTVNYARPVPLNAAVEVRTRTASCGAAVGQMYAEIYPAGQPDKLLVTASGAYSTKPNNLGKIF